MEIILVDLVLRWVNLAKWEERLEDLPRIKKLKEEEVEVEEEEEEGDMMIWEEITPPTRWVKKVVVLEILEVELELEEEQAAGAINKREERLIKTTMKDLQVELLDLGRWMLVVLLPAPVKIALLRSIKKLLSHLAIPATITEQVEIPALPGAAARSHLVLPTEREENFCQPCFFLFFFRLISFVQLEHWLAYIVRSSICEFSLDITQ